MINKRDDDDLKKTKITTPEKPESLGSGSTSQSTLNSALNSAESKLSQKGSEVKALINDI